MPKQLMDRLTNWTCWYNDYDNDNDSDDNDGDDSDERIMVPSSAQYQFFTLKNSLCFLNWLKPVTFVMSFSKC